MPNTGPPYQVDTMGHPIMSTDTEIRLRCLEVAGNLIAATRSESLQMFTQTSFVAQLAEKFRTYVETGELS